MGELQEQIRVSHFIKSAYPNIIFCSDLSGLRLPISVAKLIKLLRSGNGFTDMFIFKPNPRYHGLFIELKKTDEKLFKKNGEYKTEHLVEQADMINRLNSEGYYACFSIGEDQAIQTINDYMNNLL